jgi:hypothetical protein
MVCAMKRTLLLGSAWTVSAAAAVGLGFLAISLIDASASSGEQPVPSALTTSSDGSPTSSPSTGSAAPAGPGQQVTAGGTVYGSCAGGVPELASAPVAGWWLDDSSSAGQVEFRNGTQQIEVRVTCVDGVAQFSVEGRRADDGSGREGGTSAPVTTTSSSGDDSDGRVGGGHGADDVAPSTTVGTSRGAEPGDDSGGHGGGGQGGGGHGSDD